MVGHNLLIEIGFIVSENLGIGQLSNASLDYTPAGV